jgi:DNA-binding transcriptional LysR family regulator
MRSRAVSITSVDLNLLLVLHTVLAERNVARAAERLHVTPSAVSNALARLRDALGDPLVTRKGRGVVPTPRAIELAPRLARVVREIELTLADAPYDAASCTRTFTLAVADLGQVVWAPRLVLAMRREMPLAHLRVVGVDTLVSLGDLGSSEIDLQVGIAAKGPGIYAEPLLEERSALVARRDHPLFKRRVTRRALGELFHVRVEMVPGKNFRDPFAAMFARARVPREVVATVPSFTAAAEIAATSDLVTMLPASFLRAKGEALGLREVSAPLPAHAIRIAMCWHERTHADPAARAFRTLVREVVTARRPKYVI